MALNRERPPLGPRARLALLLAVLPMFSGVFQLVGDALPFYALSKVWPFLMLPLAVLGYFQLALPASTLFMVTLAFVISIPPLMATLHLDSTFDEALTTIVKIMPIGNYFSLSMLLFWLRPTPDDVRRAVTWLGYFSFGLLWFLWEVVPSSYYSSGEGLPTIFIGNDDVRGDRIIMSMYFGLLLLFQLSRRLALHGNFWDFVQIVAGYALMIVIYKERVPIIFSFCVILLGFVEALLRSRVIALGVALTGGMAALAVGLTIIGVGTVVDSLGGSLAVRLMSIDIAWDFLRDHPLRWLFGAGGTTAYAAVPVTVLFRNPAFFLADIGWLGVMFEYGIFGTGLIAAIHVAVLRISRARARSDAPFAQCLGDYALYLFPASLIYSLALLPGEVGTVAALAVYLHRASALPGGVSGQRNVGADPAT